MNFAKKDLHGRLVIKNLNASNLLIGIPVNCVAWMALGSIRS